MCTVAQTKKEHQIFSREQQRFSWPGRPVLPHSLFWNGRPKLIQSYWGALANLEDHIKKKRATTSIHTTNVPNVNLNMSRVEMSSLHQHFSKAKGMSSKGAPQEFIPHPFQLKMDTARIWMWQRPRKKRFWLVQASAASEYLWDGHGAGAKPFGSKWTPG